MFRQSGKPFNIRAGDAALPARNGVGRGKRRGGECLLALSPAGAQFGKHFSECFRPESSDIRYFGFLSPEQLFQRYAERRRQFAQLRYVRLRQPPLPFGNSLRMKIQFICQIRLRNFRRLAQFLQAPSEPFHCFIPFAAYCEL